MSKWADYLISKVCYTSDKSSIKEVEVRQDLGDKVSSTIEKFTRIQVINKIESNYSFITIIAKDGNWSKGANVEIVKIEGEKYIRTDKNNTKKDNLDNLPTYIC
ncbi:DUF3892 domain-containing protein [Leptospira paudalimensis]|uniref:DUF3892 domain-containing protein n=1 Tax=Leptospira paudalimensis TaxID=2950024 RepID=A0ABT3M597_9LEPT|nr:DUF3892 domain-containing protein [Leptospira paudalimensis]MCW7503565.1 DUF3892 domain-containing protein [Leptospira paudalimensis]